MSSPIVHVITCEYPPQLGGVSAYCAQLRAALIEAGFDIHVWAPGSGEQPLDDPTFHTTLRSFRPSHCFLTGRALNHFPKPRRLLVQWVPHGYGLRAMNVPFAAWLWFRAVWHGDHVDVIAHEAFLPFAGSWKQHAAALVQRFMTLLILRRARTVFISTDAWRTHFRSYLSPRRTAVSLPVPSNIPVLSTPEAAASLRAQLRPQGGFLAGHFGTYGSNDIAALLAPIAISFLDANPNAALLLLGKGSREFRQLLASRYPSIEGRLYASGALSPADLSNHLAACDLFLQPYPDGISTRRTSAMAVLAHGRALLTNLGECSDEIWTNCPAIATADAGNPQAFAAAAGEILARPSELERLAAASQHLYREHFDLSHTVRTLSRYLLACES